MNKIELIKNLGLTEKQAKVYLACLQLGASKVGKIQKESGIKRTTLYDVLEDLQKIGLVSYVVKNKTRIYNPENPHKLKELIETRSKLTEVILPDLQKMFFSIAYRPNIRFFEGVEGIKQIYGETLNCCDKKILQIVSVKDF